MRSSDPGNSPSAGFYIANRLTSKMVITPGSILDGEKGDVKVLQILACFTEIDSITI